MTEPQATIDRYGVMGYPIKHSRSPVIHRLFAIQTKQAMQYEMLQVAAGKLEQAVDQFMRTGGRGLNVTLPHKQDAQALCDVLSERARTAGAVNTLTIHEKEVHGDNTDGIGLLRDLAINLNVELKGSKILVLGAGGATRGITGPLLEVQPAYLLIANRTVSRAEAIADDFKEDGPVEACGFDAAEVDQPFDLVINATSAGFKGETPPYPPGCIGRDTLAYDLSYGLKNTPFAAWASECGAARSVMGWGMLVEQAAESFTIWRGVRPDTAPVLSRMKVNAS